MQIPVFIDSVIYTQQKLLSHIDESALIPRCNYLHIVEITQSYRHPKTIRQPIASTHSRNYLVIQTWSLSVSLYNLHIVEITQSYRHRESDKRRKRSTHSRNYLVIQTIHTTMPTPHIYTQQKLLSHIDHILYGSHLRIYTQQKLLSHIDRLMGVVVKITIYTQQKLLSHIDTVSRVWPGIHLHIVEITQSYRQRDIRSRRC